MKTNKKQEKITSTIENLPKELRDRVVYVGDASIGKDLSGNISHTNINTTDNPNGRMFPTNKATFPNGATSLTREQMFPNPSTTIPVDMDNEIGAKKEEVKEYKDISISINYGTSGGSIKSQLKEQGFKFKKELIKECEAVRLDLLALLYIDILTVKQGQKAFKKLNTIISNNVIEMTFGDVKSKLKKTFINNKEVK